jgi:uncharacterized coiled-coil DUF342 family protein
MKKLFSLLVVGLFLLAYACGGGGGDDPKSVMNAAADAFEALVNDLDGADSADEVVTAINKFADKMKELKPKIKAMEEKYPELKNMGKGEMPEEYKDIENRMKELMPKLIGLFGKLQKYAADPKVIEAQKKLQEAMQ